MACLSVDVGRLNKNGLTNRVEVKNIAIRNKNSHALAKTKHNVYCELIDANCACAVFANRVHPSASRWQPNVRLLFIVFGVF